MLPTRGRGVGAAKHWKIRRYCCYGTCSSNTADCDVNVKMLPFPKPCSIYFSAITNTSIKHDTKKCAQCTKARRWMHLCKRADSKFRDLSDINSTTYICTKHFRDPSGPTESDPDPFPADQQSLLLKRATVGRKRPADRGSPPEPRRLSRQLGRGVSPPSAEPSLDFVSSDKVLERQQHTASVRKPKADLLATNERDPLAMNERDPLAMNERDPLDMMETDPLAVNETDPLAMDEGDLHGANYTEQKFDIEDLQCPGESVDECGDRQTCERDPLEISSDQLNDGGDIKREDCPVTTRLPEAASQLVRSSQSSMQKKTQQVGKCTNISIAKASITTLQSSIQERRLQVGESVVIAIPGASTTASQSLSQEGIRQAGKSVDVAMPEASAESSESIRRVQVTRNLSCVIYDLVTKRPFRELNPIEQRRLVKEGRPNPTTLAASSEPTICGKFDFSSLYKVHGWLTRSDVLNKLFCWPCLLFDNNASPWNFSGLSFGKNTSDECTTHERSEAHVRSKLKFATFDIEQINQEQRLQAWKNREILQRLINAVCILAEMEMPKRNASIAETSLLVQTVYRDIVNMFSEYDFYLKSSLQSVDGSKFTGPEMPRDLIDSINCLLLKKIKQEVEESKFVSVICGEMSEMKNNPPLASVVVRYVDREGTVHERFVGYFKSSNVRGKNLNSYIMTVIKEFKLAPKLVSLSNDRQQGRLRYSSEVSLKFPSLLYVHNFSHSFNLVLKQDCQRIKECRLFLSMMSNLTEFFSTSSVQRNELESFLSRKLPTFTPTMLNFASRLEHTVFKFLPQLLEFFQTITDNPEKWDGSSVVSALGFRAFFRNVQNIFLTHLFATLFEYTDTLYVVPEDLEFTDYSHCATQVHTVKFMIQALDRNFEKFWEEIEMKAAECDRNQTTNPPQAKKILENTTPSDYKRLLREITYQAYAHTADTFASIEKLKFFDLLNPKNFESLTPSQENLKLIGKTYPNIFNVDKLTSELTMFYGIEDFRDKLPQQYISHLRNLTNANKFGEVYKLVCLYLTIPCTQASSEPSFSALKRIKCVREVMGQHPASNLAVMTIENPLLTRMKKLPDFYSNVTNEFAKLGKRVEYTYDGEPCNSNPVNRRPNLQNKLNP